MNSATTELTQNSEQKPSTRFEEMARRAARKLAEVRAAQLAAERAHRELQRAEAVRQSKLILERFLSEEVREELRPTYSCEELGTGLAELHQAGRRFLIEMNLRTYEDTPCPLYAVENDDKRVAIGELDFSDQTLFEARLLVALCDQLNQSESLPPGPTSSE